MMLQQPDRYRQGRVKLQMAQDPARAGEVNPQDGWLGDSNEGQSHKGDGKNLSKKQAWKGEEGADFGNWRSTC